MAKIFNEQELRKEIAKMWGEYGAHVEVIDMLIKKNKELVKTIEELRQNLKQIS